ncbi:MAG: RnfH family protein [Sulfuricellaceae bacterium]|nr:RnfH family protein [Sulfuricellaceae bacterium]
MGNPTSGIWVEIAYALPDEQVLMSIQVQPEISAEQAIRQSGILGKHPEIDLAKNKIGIFGKLSKLDTILRDRDRVEIYRPLIADPKEVRKKRAEEGKVMKKGGGDAPAAEAETQ